LTKKRRMNQPRRQEILSLERLRIPNRQNTRNYR
jgi:hypothetical protein